MTATDLDPEAVLNEPIVRCLKKIGCVVNHSNCATPQLYDCTTVRARTL
eukprot:COSAG01_NODE_665_length_14398_cov_91.714595_13_plen_49_part_00